MVRSQLPELAGLHIAALIPARGGSKGIHRKNLQHIGGQTLVARAVRTCRASFASEVYVSTEDAEIADEARAAGGVVIDRPAELATDKALGPDVLMHGLRAMPRSPDVVVWCQCTAPLLTAPEINACVLKLAKTGADSCVAAVRFRGAVAREVYQGRLTGVTFDMEGPTIRRQDQRQHWQIAGSVWALRVQPLLRTGQTYGLDCVPCEVSGPVIDIDCQLDLAMARLLLMDVPIRYPL